MLCITTKTVLGDAAATATIAMIRFYDSVAGYDDSVSSVGVFILHSIFFRLADSSSNPSRVDHV